MQIRKYSGGALLTYTPHISTSNTSASTQNTATSNGESAEDKIQKEFFDIIGEYGLHNDKNKFLSYASKLLTASQTMNLSGQTKDNITKRDLIKLHSLANQLKENADARTEAKTKIREENSGSDIALTNTGGMYAINAETGKLTVVSPTEYHNNSDKYQLLTNTDLLDLREDSPSLAFDTSILNNLEGTIGMKTITECIVKTIKDFGTMSHQHSGSQYVANSKSIENGMSQILGGAAPEGIYKISSSSSSSDQGYRNENEMFRAVQYIWSTLNGNMKNTLRATAAAEGLDPNNTLDVFRIIIDAVQLHTTHGRTSSSDVSYDSGASKAAGLGGESTGTPTQEVFGHRILKNQGNFRPSYLMLEGSKVQNILPTYHYNTIQDKDKNQVPNVTLLSETYRNLQDHGIVDTRRSAYFGSLPIESIAEAGNKILINNNDGGANVVYMPIDVVGNIDMGIFTKMMNVQKSIQERRITDTSFIQKVWEENGFDYNAELGVGQPKNYTLAPYWMQSAYTSTSQDLFDKSDLNESSLISVVDKSVVENLSGQYNMDPLHSKNKKIEIESGFLGTDYQAMIYIPLSSDEGEVLFAGGASYMPKIMSDNLHAEMQAYQRTGLYNPQTNQYSHIQSYTGNELD